MMGIKEHYECIERVRVQIAELAQWTEKLLKRFHEDKYAECQKSLDVVRKKRIGKWNS